MRTIPHERVFDSTLSVLKNPYGYLTERSVAHGSDIFQFRFLLQKTVALRGEQGAEVFYNPDLCSRRFAPEMLKSTLIGRGGVNNLKGEEHKKRKELFMSCMGRTEIERIGDLLRSELSLKFSDWESQVEVHFNSEVQTILTKVSTKWVGIPLDLEKFGLERLTKMLVSLFDDAGAKGLRHLRARYARMRMQQEVSRLVMAARQGFAEYDEASPFGKIINYRTVEGNLLSAKVASVEILNLLRPIVAVSGYLTFAAHALITHNKIDKVRLARERQYLEFFVQEVRRFYPFFPAVVGRAEMDLVLEGYKIKKGTRLMLDIFGIDHDPRIWGNPEEFDPLRFADWNGGAFNFVPQGGGDHYTGHRCAGEWITKHLMSVCTLMLLREMTFTVPEQNLEVQKNRLPAIPKSGVILAEVKRRSYKHSEISGTLHY